MFIERSNGCLVALFIVGVTTAFLLVSRCFKANATLTIEENNLNAVELDSRDIVVCFDRLRVDKEQRYRMSEVLDWDENGPRTLRNRTTSRTLHFAFVGDSRVRQFFYSFLQEIPDYDREKTTIPEGVLHEDRFAYSSLLDLFVSYQWRPTLLDFDLKNLTLILKSWVRNEAVEAHQRDLFVPDVLFIGIAVHHMLNIHGADFLLYEKELEKLEPLLKEISQMSRVVWLKQFPTNDRLWLYLSDIYTEKISRYNEITERIFRDSDVEIRGDLDSLVAEYIRSCGLNAKQDKGSDAAYFYDCLDYIHPGGVVLSESVRSLIAGSC